MNKIIIINWPWLYDNVPTFRPLNDKESLEKWELFKEKWKKKSFPITTVEGSENYKILRVFLSIERLDDKRKPVGKKILKWLVKKIDKDFQGSEKLYLFHAFERFSSFKKPESLQTNIHQFGGGRVFPYTLDGLLNKATKEFYNDLDGKVFLEGKEGLLIKRRNFENVWNHYNYKTNFKIKEFFRNYRDYRFSKELKNKKLVKKAKSFLLKIDPDKFSIYKESADATFDACEDLTNNGIYKFSSTFINGLESLAEKQNLNEEVLYEEFEKLVENLYS